MKFTKMIILLFLFCASSCTDNSKENYREGRIDERIKWINLFNHNIETPINSIMDSVINGNLTTTIGYYKSMHIITDLVATDSMFNTLP